MGIIINIQGRRNRSGWPDNYLVKESNAHVPFRPDLTPTPALALPQFFPLLSCWLSYKITDGSTSLPVAFN